MTTGIGYAQRTNEQRDIQPVAIISVDPLTRKAKALTRIATEIEIDCRVPVGGVYVIPDVGDQWYVDRYDLVWHLQSRIPFNDNNILIEPKPGQMVMGGTGPVEMNGSELNVHGPTNIDGPLTVGDVLLQDIDGVLNQSSDGGETWVPVGSGAGSNIDDITGLTEALDAKADDTDITNLQTNIDGKADIVHVHEIDDVTGLQGALDNKANASHTHGETGLSDPLTTKGDILARTDTTTQRKGVGEDGTWLKASSAQLDGLLWDLLHIGDVTGLQDELDSKQGAGDILLPGQIPGLDCSKIISGIFTPGQIPGLDVSWISGIFPAGQIPDLDASKIISGEFITDLIPALDTSWITSGTFPQSMLDITNIPAGIVSGILGGGQIPALDASKITSGEFLTSLIPNLDAGQITSGTFPQSMLDITSIAAGIVTGAFSAAQIPALDASKITSGTLLGSLIPVLDLSKIPALPADQITSGVLGTSLIPGLDAGKIVSGIFPQSMLDITNIDTSWITGILGAGQIPALDASKIVSGEFITGLIPALDTSKITSGTFPQSMLDITNIPANLVSGVLDLLQIPGLPTSQITSGVFGGGFIPALDASKIQSGTFPQSMLDITSIAAGIISGTLGEGQIPTLDASKIGSGEFLASMIPALDASKILTGTFGLAQIPLLDPSRIPDLSAAKITSGEFLTTLIPGLDVSKIISGVFPIPRIPALDATQITSGTFPQSMIQNLTSNMSAIFGTLGKPIDWSRLQNIPISSIGPGNPELLFNPNYESLESVSGGTTGWTWDPAVSHTAGGTGSARVTANGTPLQLLSDPPIPVSANQQLAVSHWLQWSGVAGTGQLFTLNVQAYLGLGISNTVQIQAVMNPAANSGWVQLSGTYTVPASGVDNIRLQLTVQSAATAGTVWWDDGSVKKTQLLREDWTSGLVGDLSNLLSGVNARTLITDTTALMSTLGMGTPTLTAIGNRLTNLGATGGFDASQLFNTNNIPKLLSTSVFGIGGIGDIGASLQQTWDKVSGTTAGAGTLPKIDTRLANLNTAGLFNAGSLFNLLGLGTLPAATIPALDGSIIQFGKVPIGQLPIGNLPTELNRITLPDVGQTLDQITNAFVGKVDNQYSLTTPPQARQSMDYIYKEFLALTQKLQDSRSEQTAINVSGKSVTFNFQTYPDGIAPAEFSLTQSGAGTSVWGIKSGAVGWRIQNNNGNTTMVAVYNVEKTNTDFQIVRGTLAGAPPGDNGGSMPRIAAIGRVDNHANPRNYVWARGYCTGFLTYKGDVGCTINGVDTTWFSNIPLTWSMDISFVIGVGTNERRYQVFSGTQLVKDFLEPGTASLFGPNYRYWGVKSELKTDSGSVVAPPFIVGCSVSDNKPPDVVGSSFRVFRASTGNVSFSGWNKAPVNFFDGFSYKSSEMGWDGTNLTIGIEGTYLVNIRYNTPAIPQGDRADCSVYKNNVPIRKMGGAFGDSYGAAEGNMFGLALVYCKVNDVLTPGYSVTATTTVSGESSGTDTFFEVALVNRSTA